MEESWERSREDERAPFEARAIRWMYWLPALFGVLLIAGVLLVVLALGSELGTS
jgi:hypothetical protein